MTLLDELSQLVLARNAIDAIISRVINRPASTGHFGEFMAKHIFDLELSTTANNRSYDGRFLSAPLTGCSVNVKYYPKNEGLLDLHPSHPPEYYLVLTGPDALPGSSRGTSRPWLIRFAFIFHTQSLHAALLNRGLQLGRATSVINQLWYDAEIYPRKNSPYYIISEAQNEMLKQFD